MTAQLPLPLVDQPRLEKLEQASRVRTLTEPQLRAALEFLAGYDAHACELALDFGVEKHPAPLREGCEGFREHRQVSTDGTLCWCGERHDY